MFSLEPYGWRPDHPIDHLWQHLIYSHTQFPTGSKIFPQPIREHKNYTRIKRKGQQKVCHQDDKIFAWDYNQVRMVRKKIPPVLYVLIGFSAAILLGSILLLFPFAAKNNISIINAVFTATSAVCVTGLTVVETGSHFSTFGQIVIMLLIKIGGLGIMSFTSLLFIFSGKELGLTEKMIIDANFTSNGQFPFKIILRNIFLFSISLEIVGALILYRLTWHDFDYQGNALFTSLFHSVSAFNNAGFSTYPKNLMSFSSHTWYCATIIFLIIAGGIGFLVIRESFSWIKGKGQRKISLHTKAVLLTTALLILSATVFIFILEKNNSLATFPFKDKVLISVFHSISPRTAGFNTIPISALTSSTIVLVMILMFIGASPGSTGGGIKTTTFLILLASFFSKIKGKPTCHLFKRRLPAKAIENAHLIFMSSILWILFAVLSINIADAGRFSLLQIFFEVISALGTVGLSLGITPHLSIFSKIVIIVTMLVGRIGFIQIITLFHRDYFIANIEYPEETMMVG